MVVKLDMQVQLKEGYGSNPERRMESTLSEGERVVLSIPVGSLG